MYYPGAHLSRDVLPQRTTLPVEVSFSTMQSRSESRTADPGPGTHSCEIVYPDFRNVPQAAEPSRYLVV